MSNLNEIYKVIDAETEACVEDKYSLWKFKPRHKLKPECYQQATARHANELNAARAQSAIFENILNEKTTEVIQSQSPMITIGAVLIALIVIYYLFK